MNTNHIEFIRYLRRETGCSVEHITNKLKQCNWDVEAAKAILNPVKEEPIEEKTISNFDDYWNNYLDNLKYDLSDNIKQVAQDAWEHGYGSNRGPKG